MHSIRSKARHAAWRVDDEEPNWNPFARRTGRTRSSLSTRREDVEQGLRLSQTAPEASRPSTHSEECITTEEEANRTRERDFNKPQHANTFSSTTASNNVSPITNEHEAQGQKESTEGSGADQTISDKTIVADKPRNRKGKLAALFPKKNDESTDDEKLETDSKKSVKPITLASQLRAVFFGSWINILLLMVPTGFVLNYVLGTDSSSGAWAVFIVNFIAIIPLAAILSYSTEELALRVGETLGGLLNATFGNAVELIVSIIALVKDEIVIVQTSLIGSMLSNLLLVLGMCFFFGGVNRLEQNFNVTVAQTASSLLALAIGSLIIPTAFHQFSGAGEDGVAPISRGTAILLLVVYACYLLFQLKTHSAMYNAPSPKAEKRKGAKKEEGESFKALAGIGGASAAVGRSGHPEADLMAEQDEEPQTPELSIWGALVTLAGATVLIAFLAEFMVDAITKITCSGTISATFVGLILLPIVGNAAEHATSVTVAVKDKMDLAIGVAVGSSMQIALLVFPLVVVIGWIMGKDDMTLVVDGFQISLLFVAVILVNYLIQDGKSHWLEGVLLMTLYLIISVSAWFYPKASGIDCATEG